MTHSQEEIINALKVLKETCYEQNCKSCPFGTNEEECLLQKFAPVDYYINGEKAIWRALQ